ncbi:DUF2804 domain-containing protein [Propionicimonas sp.]|uniref:DUF2804 domain-containing protein n=1 Tax=Propionicimonas sp. TaxID=1955623 RepID=UPI0039E2A6B8
MAELTQPVSLTLADGSLNPDAVGWARRPLVDTSGIGGRHGWGRNKRWEYWSVVSPTHVLTLTVSSIDYAAVHSVWVFDRAMRRPRAGEATVLPSRGVRLAPSHGAGPAYARAHDLAIAVEPEGTSTRLRARIPGAEFDVVVTRPPDRDCLAVVVPWTDRTFQYTVKDIGLPAAGSARIDGVRHEVPAGESWAVLDHGRGRWPYRVRWNWGAGWGISGGHEIGVQVGGSWTVGTGATENGILIDGVLHKIDVELDWSYDLADWRRPWRVVGGGLDATFTPDYDRKASTNLGVVASRTDQCFGHWSGAFGDLSFDGLYGWAEDVTNRW